MIIGADVGGTFTDVVAIADGDFTIRKVPTTTDPSDAIRRVLSELVPESGATALLHGTTVATNALLERAGARTALVTDVGFEDVIEIGRQDRPALYDPTADRAEPLVARSDRHGVEGTGAPDVADVEAIAIVLVRGHEEAEREAAIAGHLAARSPGTPISRSSVVAPEFREFERASTTVLNAYLTPVTAHYLTRLGAGVLEGGLARAVAVMRSSGGLMSVAEAAALPAAILLSGPAGGVVAASAVASAEGLRSVVSFDMGGTSTDVCLIVDGEIDISYERAIAGHACRMPAVGVHTVGAGGGSIAWIDSGGALRVGPRSAGSHPGPACYGRGGTEPTVTDANVVLGRIDPGGRLGGVLDLEPHLAGVAVGRLAERLGRGVVETALGILAIAEETMAGAARTVAVSQGHDPRGSHVIAFGGAGALHASAVGRRLDMAGVIVPPAAGVLSAVGLVLSPPRSDAVRALLITDDDLTPAVALAEDLRQATAASVRQSGSQVVSTRYSLDVRYLGQAHEIAVAWEIHEGHDVLVERFEELHRQRYGFERPGDPLEVVAIRATSIGEPPLAQVPDAVAEPLSSPQRRLVIGADGVERSAAILDRAALSTTDWFDGPVVIEERDTTIFVDHDERVRRTESGSVEVTW